MTIKVAAVSMVKNECDIMELFIKLNSRFIDAFYILDHFSADGTIEIVKGLKALGYPINYTNLSDSIYNQSEITTKEVRRVASLGIYDYIIPLDADEFVEVNSRSLFHEILSNEVTRKGVGHLPWATYCPVNGDYFNTRAPLYHNFRRRNFEPDQYYKVVIGCEYAISCNISMGNHSVKNAWKLGPPFMKYLNSIFLQHVPVRSEAQIIRKAILGSHAFSVKKGRKKGEGYHWDLIAEMVRKNDYHIDDEQLLELGMSYATKASQINLNYINEDSIRIGTANDDITFSALSEINISESFDREIGRLSYNIRNISLLNRLF